MLPQPPEEFNGIDSHDTCQEHAIDWKELEEKNMMTMAKTPVNEQVAELVICMIGDTTTAVSLNNLAGTSDLVKSDLADSTE